MHGKPKGENYNILLMHQKGYGPWDPDILSSGKRSTTLISKAWLTMYLSRYFGRKV